ncbi:hypothetical protein B0H65DRAFT_585968 [Neurospora tetraspora]|uniref:Uncharacterized protein n=1 Tax=Neurospora tetraspora TaxID=94610 RepID=A0AAE0JJ07_9PEZI|nr:hypothetical protein B0H65DRAFT_585968 [Neurospora tetraspora]
MPVKSHLFACDGFKEEYELNEDLKLNLEKEIKEYEEWKAGRTEEELRAEVGDETYEEKSERYDEALMRSEMADDGDVCQQPANDPSPPARHPQYPQNYLIQSAKETKFQFMECCYRVAPYGLPPEQDTPKLKLLAIESRSNMILDDRDVAFVKVDKPFEGDLNLFKYQDTPLKDTTLLGVIGSHRNKTRRS